MRRTWLALPLVVVCVLLGQSPISVPEVSARLHAADAGAAFASINSLRADAVINLARRADSNGQSHGWTAQAPGSVSVQTCCSKWQGFDFTGADCSGWMREAGFRDIRVEPLTAEQSMVVGIKLHVFA